MRRDLRRYWPGGQTALLLKAAFHSDIQVARESWRRWLVVCDFETAPWNDLRVASLAHRRLGHLADAGALEPRLVGLRRYIWSSGRMRIDAATPLLREFAKGNITFMPIKGAVLLARNSRAVSDRFLADIDVLIDPAHWENAVTIALEQGWAVPREMEPDVVIYRMRQRHHSLEVTCGTHGSVDLHQFSLLLNRQLGADVLLWRRAGKGTLNGVSVLLPHPSDQLAITFGHAFFSGDPRSYDWVADAFATISAPGFDWDLFSEVIMDRELAVHAGVALTYLAEELQCKIPEAAKQAIATRIREPFLSEFATSYRTYVPDDAQECQAIYEAECIRSRHFLGRVAIQRSTPQGRKQVDATIGQVKLDQKFALPMPSGINPTDRVQFRLRLDIADDWRSVSALTLGKSLLVRLGCFDSSIELGRLRVRSKGGGALEIVGEIDGALVVGRGIDELWLSVKVARAAWLRRWLSWRYRISDYVGRGERTAAWYRRLREPRNRVLRAATTGPDASGVESQPGVIIQGGSFEASVLRSADRAQ